MKDAENGVGDQVKILRQRSGLSIRRLAQLANVAPGVISSFERGKNSPSLATLQKILSALGTDLAGFFGGQQEVPTGPVYVRESMKVVSDKNRSYTVILPRKQDITIEIFDEHLSPGERKSPYETLPCDIAGYVLSGSLLLDVKGDEPRILRAGDAFYIKQGVEHHGCAHDEPVRLITICSPPKY